MENPSTNVQVCRWHPVPDAAALQRLAAAAILASATTAIDARGGFHLVLAGGDTPRPIYRTLAAATADWRRWHVYFGDERCLPPDDPARNSRMASAAWLGRVPIPPDQVHAIAGEKGALEAARRYAEVLRGLGDFDLVLLGLGEDGHTASLFPGHEWGDASGDSPRSPDTLAVFDAPREPAERVSMTAARLSRARQVIFLASGASKRGAVAAWRSGRDIPARAIRPAKGVDVFVESALLAPWPAAAACT